MSGKRLNITFADVDRDGARARIDKAWVYWREKGKKLILRVSKDGRVFQHTSGPADKPSSYTTLFTAREGDKPQIAYNIEPDQLDEPRIVVRLEKRTVKQSLSATAARIPAVVVPPGGTKKIVKVLPLPLALINLTKYRRFHRAVAAIRFGGLPSDAQARNMDKFLDNNYGQNKSTEFKGSHNGKPIHELRRTVKASGALPIDIIKDIATAAKALEKDDANLKVVAVVAHGNDEGIARRNPGVFLNNKMLTDLLAIRADLTLARKALKRANDELERAKASGDLEEIQAAQEEVNSREAQVQALDTTGALPFIEAFEQAARALQKAEVDVVELQACGRGGPSQGVSPLSFRSKLARLLSVSGRNGHTVTVKGHPDLITSERKSGTVTCWLGETKEKGKPGSQTSTETLPAP